MRSVYTFPLCIQLSVPLSINDPAFKAVLALLSERSFYGVELNLTDFENITPKEVLAVLRPFNLRLTMIASGGWAKKNHVSLSQPDEKERNRSVCQVKKVISYAGELGSGVIFGFAKGEASIPKAQAVESFGKSMDELSDFSRQHNVTLLIEATNHYEAPVANTLSQAAEFAGYSVNILPDTYHMNIEEADWRAALRKYSGLYKSIHISDNNRYFPGFGGINFREVFSFLKEIDYRGLVSVEGNVFDNLHSDIIKTSEYLREISAGL